MNAKERFLKMTQAKAFADICTSEPFLLALDYAMLEMQSELPLVGNEIEDRIVASRLHGAQQFRRILQTIAIPQELPGPVRTPKLNYDAYDKPARTG